MPSAGPVLGPALVVLTVVAAGVTSLADRGFAVVHQCVTVPGPWRVADQKYYVSDTRKFEQSTGWHPQVSVREGLSTLYRWLRDNRALLTVREARSQEETPPLRAAVGH